MSHKVYRLLSSLYNSPQLIQAEAFKPIVEFLQERNKTQFIANVATVSAEESEPEQVGGIGEIKIDGVITYKPVYGVCDDVAGTSYTGILEQAEELIEQGVNTILMTFSSPGGQAAHAFTSAEELRAMCTEAGVSLISYVDEYAASAALVFSVIADEVYIHPSASTGSVGCCLCLYDTSKAMEMIGVKPVYIVSTPGKTAFEDNGSFSKGFLDDLQEDVTRLGNEFADHVSKYTGIPVETIIAMDAKMFHAEAAVEVGLANAVMDHKQFAAYLADKQG